MVHQFRGKQPTGGELLDFLLSVPEAKDLPIRTGLRLSMDETSPADIEVCQDYIFLAFPPVEHVMDYDFEFDEEFSSE